MPNRFFYYLRARENTARWLPEAYPGTFHLKRNDSATIQSNEVKLMIPFEDARQTILSRVKALPPEKMHLPEALGRYLAEDVRSPFAIPMSDNSAMDGYAVRTDDISAPGTRLSVIYELPAGAMPRSPIGPDQAIRIMTGAPLPPGADAVVIRELTEEHEKEVIINTVPRKYDHVRLKGEDIARQAIVLPQGTHLGPAQIGVLASVGQSIVHCHQRPVVAVLGTGDEVVDLNETLTDERVFSSNSYTLISLIKACGAIPLYLGIARDNRRDLIRKLDGARRADLILTSGGVSLGDFDLVRNIMNSGENRMAFWKVAMKPGRPLAFGEICGIPIIGLPGNPVATMVSFYQFARPAILKMMGATHLLLPSVTARLQTALKGKPDRMHFLRGVLRRQGPDLVVAPTGPQGSGILTSMARANCFIVLPKGNTSTAVNQPVECEIFDMAANDM